MAAPGFLEGLSPWGSRAATPKLSGAEQSPVPPPSIDKQKTNDHRVSQRYRIAPKDYPEDCPPLRVRWFYATDVPKRKPQNMTPPGEAAKDAKKPPAEPKKYVPFSPRDSQSIELAFHKLAEEKERTLTQEPSDTDLAIEDERASDGAGSIGDKLNTSMHDDGHTVKRGSVKVPVNEDFLFDVDVDARELGPAYWLGPIYEVRRASWFFAEGSGTRMCDENLAGQLEEGYVKAKPWRYEPVLSVPQRSTSRTPRPASWMFGDGRPKTSQSPDPAEARDLSVDGRKEGLRPAPASKPELQTHRLFGVHMNSIVTYENSTVAWLLTDDFLSRMSSTVYQRFAGGGHLGGIKLIRGYQEPGKTTQTKQSNKGQDSTEDSERGRSGPTHRRGRSEPVPSTKESDEPPEEEEEEEGTKEPESTRTLLEKQISQLSSLVGGGDKEAEAAAQEEEVRRKEEEEIRDDYKASDGADQDREIEHLILVTHGIGQRLGQKLESLNFIHDVNVLRKSLKGIYEKSPDLQALNAEIEKLPKNCRVQVLPIVWRPLLDFPHQSFKDNKEKDLSDANTFGDDLGYPTLKDITVEGIAPIRNLVEDLFLDILLYQSNYRDRIVRIIRKECNRVYGLFCQRNPEFRGKISLVGHSLGSALFFDLLCHQTGASSTAAGTRSTGAGSWLHRSHSINKVSSDSSDDLALDFPVEDFYALGSPIGLFQMIKGKNIAARQSNRRSEPGEDALGGSSAPMEAAEVASTSSPQCAQIYNIFHPTDPVAYRMEPLISPAMKELKPQNLPYVKKGIFDVPGQGLSGIGMRVGQSVSGLWSSVTTGVASSLLNRSLGIQPVPAKEGSGQGYRLMNLTSYYSGSGDAASKSRSASLSETPTAGEPMPQDMLQHPPTLIDAKLDTLYAGFQRQRKTVQGTDDAAGRDLGRESADWTAAEDRSRQLRREEAKVRALNGNGRVDYSLQEGVFDISLIGSIASHLSYWADEDVNHFIISQLLARQRVVKREAQGGTA